MSAGDDSPPGLDWNSAAVAPQPRARDVIDSRDDDQFAGGSHANNAPTRTVEYGSINPRASDVRSPPWLPATWWSAPRPTP